LLFDSAGRIATVSDGTGIYRYSYTAGGLLASVADPAGRTIGYGYDNAGRRTKMTYPDGNTIMYGYDTAGRVASLTPGETLADNFTGVTGTAPIAVKWATGLTAGGTATVQGNELGLSWITTANSAAKITSKAPAAVDQNVTVRYRFANMVSPGTFTVQARSSTTGNYRVVIGATIGTATVFKQVGTVSTVLGTFVVPVGTASRRVRFQVQGTAIKARVWADGTTEPVVWNGSFTDATVTATGATFVAATRTAAGANTVFVDDFQQYDPSTPPAAVAVYGYNVDDQLTVETLLAGTRTRTYTTGRLTGFAQNLPGSVIATSRTYDTTGRIGTETTGTVTTTFGYDVASQLKTVTPSTGAATVYSYDKLGRRATSKAGTAAAVTYTYDAASELTAIGANTFTYDLAGRRLTDTTTATNKASYTYDQAGRLATIGRVNGTTATTQTRAYTPSNLLASVSNLTGTTTTTTGIDWDTNRAVPEPVDFVSTALTDLVNGPGGWAAQKVGLTSTAIAHDVYGSVVPSTGVTIGRNATYSAFGQPAGANSFEPRLGYRGELTFDNLVYLRSRNYDPARGQFTSRDPVDGANGTPTVGNPYHYVNNKPVDGIDPMGLFRLSDAEMENARHPHNSFLDFLATGDLAGAGLFALQDTRTLLPAAGLLARAAAGVIGAITLATATELALLAGAAVVVARSYDRIERNFYENGWGAWSDPFGTGRAVQEEGLGSGLKRVLITGGSSYKSDEQRSQQTSQESNDPSDSTTPATQSDGNGANQPPPNIPSACGAANDGGSYSERELKEAENELRRNKDFRNWFHREYKGEMGTSVGNRSNPDLDRNMVRDAYEEWIECGKPRAK
jgi:RHS repeat-associated protein